MSEEVKPGKDTTEFEETKKADVMTIVGTILGVVIAYAPKLLELAPEDSKWAIIGGAAVIIISQIQSVLVKLGYIQSRTAIKVEAEKEKPSE